MSAKDTYAYREQCLLETNAYQIIIIVRIKSLLETSLMSIRDLSVILIKQLYNSYLFFLVPITGYIIDITISLNTLCLS